MPIHRVKKSDKKRFVQIEKTTSEDRRLTWKARGILAYLLGKPDNFVFYLDKIAEDAPDGIDSLRAGIKELQDLNYVKRYPVKVKGKIVSWAMDVYEIPHTELPHVEKPYMENPTLKISKELKDNNKTDNKRYILLDIEGNKHIKVYNHHFKKRYGKDHMAVSEENLVFIEDRVESIRRNSDFEDWEERVEEHFNNLPKGNNGSILPFLYASYRFFNVNEFN